jgi:hypothetical protein
LNASRLDAFRNTVLIFGLWFLSGLVVAGPLGFAMNALPSYTASSTRPGSQVAMHLITSIPQLIGAFAAGIFSVVLLRSSRISRWAIALSALFAVFHLSSGWSFGWEWLKMEAEIRIGMILSALLIGFACWAGFVIAKRRQIDADALPA